MRVLAGVLAVLVTGCSILSTTGPPSPVPAQGPIHCDTSAGNMLELDIVFGTLFGLVGYWLGKTGGELFVHCAEDGSSCPEKDGSVARGIGMGLLFSVPWYLSAWGGASRASDCRELKTKTGR